MCVTKLSHYANSNPAHLDLLASNTAAALAAAKKVPHAGMDLSLKGGFRLEDRSSVRFSSSPPRASLVTDARARYASASHTEHVHV